MNPATPPRSRYAHLDTGTDTETAPGASQLRTPAIARTPNKGGSRSIAPVTPSTVQKHAPQLPQGTRLQFKSGPFLQPPQGSSQHSMTSPFNGMKSPEYTPMRRSSITATQQPLNSVSRVLFPQGNDESAPLKRKKTSGVQLLPPQPTTPTRAPLRPSTPTDKVTDFSLAQKWHNTELVTHSDEEEGVVKEVPLQNPFMSNEVPSKETRVLRRMQLLQEDPELGTHITYVDKRGEPARRRRLSQRAQQQKPRMLFEEQLYAEDRSDVDEA